jgi:hypothetical protein
MMKVVKSSSGNVREDDTWVCWSGANKINHAETTWNQVVTMTT